MRLNLATSTLRRDTGNLPELRLKGMISERTAASASGVVLQSLPGLTTYSEVGSGPINGLFSRAGVFNGNLFGISGDSLYRGSTLMTGSLNGASKASFASAGSQLAVNRGQGLFVCDGATLEPASFPDSANVRCVTSLGSRGYAVRADTDRIYFSEVLDLTDWPALNYISAEQKPDPVYDLQQFGEEIVALGPQSVQFLQETGDADAPLAAAAGRTMGTGLLAPGCSDLIDDALVWVAQDYSVRTYDGGARRLSDAAIDERIAASSTVTLFAAQWNGHPCAAIRLDDTTLLVDASTGDWTEEGEIGGNWRAQCSAFVDGQTLYGSALSGKVYSWSGWDFDGDSRERVFSAAAPLEGPFTVHSIEVEANVGQTDLLAGQGSNPILEMRVSRDGGITWGQWRSTTLGAQGNYRARARINRWGMFDPPGVIVECRTTDPIPLRVTSVIVNGARGGRAR